MKSKTVLLVGVLLAASLSIEQLNTAADSPPFAWELNDSSVALTNGSHTIWRFNHGTENDKVFFHPLALIDGTELTDESHANHPWHHALWFTWKYINEVNFWEEDKATGKSKGEIVWSDIEVDTRPDHTAEISMKLAYSLTEQEEPVLREERTISVSAPDAKGTYRIDWKSVFTACSAEDVVLDRTPIEGQPGGKSYGGYAGLSVRFKGAATDVQVHTETGRITQWSSGGTYNGRAWSMDYSGLVGQQTAGIAIFEDPGNLNAPTTWYTIDSGFKYFSPAVIFQRPHTLKARESMTLKYRVFIHQGRWTADTLRGKFVE